MFILALLSDTLTLKPKDFGRDKKEIIVDELNIKYSNKIIPNLGHQTLRIVPGVLDKPFKSHSKGMCIAVRAIENVQHPKHIAGTSGVHIRVTRTPPELRDAIILEIHVYLGAIPRDCVQTFYRRGSSWHRLKRGRNRHNGPKHYITLGGFFDDIYVGKSDLPFPSEYDKDKV
eukprot:1387352-Amorphochlora_amoeboformis.AAC.1